MSGKRTKSNRLTGQGRKIQEKMTDDLVETTLRLLGPNTVRGRIGFVHEGERGFRIKRDGRIVFDHTITKGCVMNLADFFHFDNKSWTRLPSDSQPQEKKIFKRLRNTKP